MDDYHADLCFPLSTWFNRKGAEFVSRDLDLWAYQRGGTPASSRPGKPTDNALIEGLNGKFRVQRRWQDARLGKRPRWMAKNGGDKVGDHSRRDYKLVISVDLNEVSRSAGSSIHIDCIKQEASRSGAGNVGGRHGARALPAGRSPS